MARAEPGRTGWLPSPARRHPDLIAAAAFACLALLVVRDALLPGRALLPLDILRVIAPWADVVDWRVHNGALSDVIFQGYPFRAWFTERLRAGEFPLWHPDILAGHPIAGDGVAQIFYPLRLLLAPLPVPFAMSLSAAIHLFIAGAGAYGLCRALGSSRPAALLGGLTYELSGVLIVWLSFPQRQSTTSWMPAVLWAVAALAARPGARPVVGLAASLALLWLGGMFQFAAYASLLAAAFALFCCADRAVAERDLRALLRRLVALAVAAVLGLLLAAPQLLPALELASLSHREPLPADYAARVALPAQRLLQWVAPNLFGTPLSRSEGSSGFMESTGYVGVLPLFLALAAWPLRRDRTSGFFALALLATTLLAAGTPLVGLLYTVPGFNLFNVTRMVVLIPVCVVPLAALALDALRSPGRPARRWPILVLPAAAVVALALAAMGRWPDVPGQALFADQVIVPAVLVVASAVGLALLLLRPDPLRLGLVLLLAAADLASFALPFNTISPLDRLYPLVPPLDQAVASARGGRLLLVPDAHFVVGPNVPSVLGLAEVGGYSSTTLRRFREAIAAITPDTGPGWMHNPNIVTFNLVDSRILRLFAVTHLLVEGDRGLDLRPAGDGEQGRIVVEPGRPLRQAFVDPADGLNAIALRLAEPLPDPPAELELVLRRSGSDTEIARVRGSSADAADGWVRFPFKAERDSGGREYVLEVAVVDGRAVALRPGRGGEVANARSIDAGASEVAPKPLALTLGHRPSAALTQLARENGVRLYAVPEPVARARLVHEALTVDSSSAVLHELASPAFDPRRRVILEGTPSFASVAPEGEDRVTLVAAAANFLRLEVQAGANGWLVVADNLYPGWEAWLDGAPVPVLAANHTQRAVAVPAGHHQVEFRFSPLSVRLGLAAALVALLTCGLVLAVAGWRGRAGRGVQPE